MVINKHNSIYLRNTWGTKIIQAINTDEMIFSKANESKAANITGLNLSLVKALRYWADVMGLTTEPKIRRGIKKEKTELCKLIEKYDPDFQNSGTLWLLHRNIARDKKYATSFYWFFNVFEKYQFDKEEFINNLYSYLMANNFLAKKNNLHKEFSCLKNTYIKIEPSNFHTHTNVKGDGFPLLSPLSLLKVIKNDKLERNLISRNDIPLPVFVYSIIIDNYEDYMTHNHINIYRLIEETNQVGKYYSLKYKDLILLLEEAAYKKLLIMNTEFGNTYIEFAKTDPELLLSEYYMNKSLL